MPSPKRQLGDLGEQIAVDYLKNQNYQILERNYLKPWGEIDIVAKNKDGVVAFVEVKTRKTGLKPCFSIAPEENVHFQKQKKLIRTAKSYLSEKKYPPEALWQIDVIAVELNMETRKARLRHYENAVYQQ